MNQVSWTIERLLHFGTIIDILVVSIFIYWLLWVAQGTRALSVIRGIVTLFLILYLLGRMLDLQVLNYILASLWPVTLVAIPVIFQPELRRAFEHLGHAGTWIKSPFPAQDDVSLEHMIDEVTRASQQLSRLRYGALIVIERDTNLQDFIDNGVSLNADISRQLLINIFYPNSPLHDAAVVIGDNRILAASVVLPLTDNISASSSLGTRHRAAIGITEESDALAVVVSEETGQMSVAHSDRLIRNLDQDRMRRVLRTLLRIDTIAAQRQESGPLATIRKWLHLPVNGTRNTTATESRATTRRESRTP